MARTDVSTAPRLAAHYIEGDELHFGPHLHPLRFL